MSVAAESGIFGDEVRIVSSLTRSGSSTGQSDSIVNAITMRLEEAEYRVCGVPIVYEDLDGGSEERGSWDAAREEANARYAAVRPDVLAYIGTLDTDAAPYSIPITNMAGPLLMVSPCNTYPGLTKPFGPGEPEKHYPTGRRNYLRTALSDHLQGLFAAQWVAALGMRRAFVLHDSEPCGRGVALPFADACRHLGVELAGSPVGIVPKRPEYNALARTIAESRADLVFFGGIIQNGAGALWRDIRAAAPAITMMGPDTLFERAFIHEAGTNAEGTLITFGGVPPALLDGKGRGFYERYVERFGQEPECYAASAFDTVGVIVQAIERVGRPDRAAITEAAFATHDFDGVLGRWSFDANGDIDLRRCTRLTIRDGRFEPLSVEPIEA